MRLRGILFCMAATVAVCFGGTVQFPGGPLTVPGINPAGASFVFSGTLTQTATIDFTQSGTPCLQGGGVYCTNGAGVVVIAGSSGPGAATTFTGTFGATTGTWDFGALLMSISGVGTVQIFPATAANGLGSGAPPASLALPTTSLSALGFPAFSVTNPTITFFVADNNYPDNSGSFTLTQSGPTPTPTPNPNPTPLPNTLLLILCALVALGLLAPRLRRTS